MPPTESVVATSSMLICHYWSPYLFEREIVLEAQFKHQINNSCTWGSKHALVICGLKLFNFFQFENSGGLNFGFAYALCREFQEYLAWFFRGGVLLWNFFCKNLEQIEGSLFTITSLTYTTLFHNCKNLSTAAVAFPGSALQLLYFWIRHRTTTIQSPIVT
jgi:hypothetical protein